MINTKMKIIITGASGFIGKSFWENNKNHELMQVSLSRNALSSYDFHNYDALLHLSALVHQMKGAPESEYFLINSDLTFETAKKAKESGVKHFIFMSSIKACGESSTIQKPFTEKSICYPIDPYGKSKLDAENKIMLLADNEFQVAVIRSPLVYGAGVKANMYNLIRLVDKLPFLPFDKINNRRSFVYVMNLVALISKIIESESSGIYLASDPESISTSELIRSISRALNKKKRMLSTPSMVEKILSHSLPSVYDRLWGSLEVDPAQGWNNLGFIPPFTTEMGIQETVKWYLDLKQKKE